MMMEEIPIDGEEWSENAPEKEEWNDHLQLCGEMDEAQRLRCLEEEQEQLNSSLIALTSHFAQVQFRLKQIVEAPQEEKEKLLKDLEEFAFRGIPDVRSYENMEFEAPILTEQDHEEKLAKQRTQQKELIAKLKEQLEDLEKYAYETGEAGLPQSMLIERQSVIIEQLRGKIPLPLDELHRLGPDELRAQVDSALRQLIVPARMKEQLVSQLKTQITDLERFIQFLQGEGTSNCTCNCKLHGKKSSVAKGFCNVSKKPLRNLNGSVKNEGQSIVQRALSILHMITMTFGCGSRTSFHRNALKHTPQGSHWGDLRAQLEVAINHVIELAASQEPPCEDSDYTSDSEDAPIIQCNEKLTTAVRKDLAIALRQLIEHGLGAPGHNSSSLVPLGCFSLRAASSYKMMHAWDLILKFYEIKNGKQFNCSPARKLSQSFNLEIVGANATTPKQTLLGTIFNIISSHTPLKRSPDAHFKAFVCAALNQKKLVTWLRLIFKTKSLVECCYQPWSYVAKTGFEDAFKSMDRLTLYDFDLPVDLAIRQLQSIKDAF